MWITLIRRKYQTRILPSEDCVNLGYIYIYVCVCVQLHVCVYLYVCMCVFVCKSLYMMKEWYAEENMKWLLKLLNLFILFFCCCFSFSLSLSPSLSFSLFLSLFKYIYIYIYIYIYVYNYFPLILPVLIYMPVFPGRQSSHITMRRSLAYAHCIPWRSIRPHQKPRCFGYDTKLHLRLWFWRPASTPSLPLLPDPLWSGVLVPVRVPSMSQIDILEYYSYLIGILDAT